MENIFTSEYKSRLFRSLHDNQECSVIQNIYLSRNDGNAYIINFIDASYVKTEINTLLKWLRSILEVIAIIEPKGANID